MRHDVYLNAAAERYHRSDPGSSGECRFSASKSNELLMTSINSRLKRIASKTEAMIFGSISPIDIEFAQQEASMIFDEEIFSMPALHEYHTFPPTIFSSYSVNVPKSKVFCIRNAMCIADREEIFTEDGRVIKELTSQRKNPMIGKSGRILRKLKRKRYFGKVVHLSLNHLEDNYYHFNVEFLARWYTFHASRIKADYIIWPMRTRFQKDFANLLGLCKKILITADDSLIQADTLVVPTLINNYKTIESDGFTFYRKLWLPSWIRQAYETVQRASAAQFNAEVRPRNIYISRQNAQHRKVLNESELRQELDKHNFVTLNLEEMSVGEQINKFRDAQVVVAPHGAGLVNMSYSGQPLKILELYSKRHHDSGFRIQSSILGHKYDFLIGEKASNCGLHPGYEDIVVDVSKVRRWLKHNL